MPTRADYEEALHRGEGSRSEAARLLGVSLSSVSRACDRFGLEFRPGPRRRETEKVRCATCGEVIARGGLCAEKYLRRRFCSRQCKDAAQRGRRRVLAPREPPALVPCAGCGRLMERYATDLRRFHKLYCSTACRKDGAWVACSGCGERIWRPRSKLRAGRGRFFCSAACARNRGRPSSTSMGAPAGS